LLAAWPLDYLQPLGGRDEIAGGNHHQELAREFGITAYR